MKMKKILSLPALFLFSSIFASPDCSRIVYTDNFNTAAGWNSAGTGLVSIANNVVYFNDAYDDHYDRIYKGLPVTISDTYFRAKFKFSFSANPIGYGTGVNLLGLSAGTLDPLSYDASANYTTTNQDGLILVLTGGAQDNNFGNWKIQLETKKGNVRVTGINTVALSGNFQTYYVLFERTSPSTTTLSLYTDSLYTNLFSQAQNTINSTITNLNTLHIGTTTWGYYTRHYTGYVDNVWICDDNNSPSAIQEENKLMSMNVFPNPSLDGKVTVAFQGQHDDGVLTVYDEMGKLVFMQNYLVSDEKIELQLSLGSYFLIANEPSRRSTSKIIVTQ